MSLPRQGSAERDRMRPVRFPAWLAAQARRDDAIGALARRPVDELAKDAANLEALHRAIAEWGENPFLPVRR
ncbi:hypothetical protein BH10PSE3_BH10PSE3_36070 [soil metagenome]